MVLSSAALLLLLASVETHGAVVLIEPYGDNAFRVRVAPPGGATSDDTITALLPVAKPTLRRRQAQGEDQAAALVTQTNGNLKVETIDGRRIFSRVSDGKLLVTESSVVFGAPMASHALPMLNATFSVAAAELYGLGQHRQACYESGGFQTPPLLRTFTSGGTVRVDLARGEGGASNTLPWLTAASHSDGGAEFGFWLNNPAMGHVVFDATDDANRTMAWQLGAAVQLDYLITTPSAKSLASGTGAFSLIEDFTAWVGRSPGLPEWALGYWHSKNRYASQAELLAAAHGFANRSIPVDIIIIDWMHWKVQGDWHFDPEYWPDPSALVKEINGLGMEVMVTVWPFSHNGSLSYDKMLEEGWLTQTVNESQHEPSSCPSNNKCPRGIITLPDGLHGGLVDVTNSGAMDYVWSMLEDGYYKHGIRSFWLDASEPEYYEFPQWGKVNWPNAKWQNGSLAEIGQMFCTKWVQAIHAGLRSVGETSSVMLPRGGYAGTWRYGAGLWSGDIWCDFATLAGQVRTGVSAQISGFGLWTTDIGGFTGPPGGTCTPGNSSYDELVTRWFQFGCTCPIFRQHGSRPTELWHYGAEAEATITEIIKWRVTMKPYLVQEMAKLHATGRPINRPLWWDFPEEPDCWQIDDQYMFGDDYIAAPVLAAGVRSRDVYLPGGAGAVTWQHVFTNETFVGGKNHTIAAPLNSFPLFKRVGGRTMTHGSAPPK